VRDLSSGTALYTAVNNLRTLVAGTALTDAVIGMRDLSVTTSALYTAINNMRTLTAGTALTNTLIQVRDLTAGTPLYTTVTDLDARLTAVEDLSGTPSSTLYTTVTGLRDATGTGTLVTQVANMRNLVAGSSTMATTLIAMRDKTGSSALVKSLPCYGEAPASAWVAYVSTGSGLYVDVSISVCGFATAPRHISASLYGLNVHWSVMGTSSIYYITNTQFRIYILPAGFQAGNPSNIVNTPQTPQQAADNQWRINWEAVP